MTKLVIANGTTANDGTGDTLRSAATKINSNFSELYSFLGGLDSSLTTKISIGDGTITFEGTTADDFETTLTVTDPTADRTLTLPNATDTLVGKATTDTLTNKTFDVEGTGNSISNIDVADFKAAAIVIESEGIGSNDNDTTLPTSAAVKDYVDNNSSGTANALVASDSDFTLTDGIASGIHYELDNTDMADWNAGGVALTTNGGIFRHHQTQAATYTVATNEGAVMAGPITITGTVTNNGTMVVI